VLAREELSAWLWLLHATGVGPASSRRLLAAFGSPQAVLQAREATLRQVVAPDLARALGTPPPGHAALVAATWRWLETAEPGAPRHLLTLGDPAYPPALLQTADPPLLLYACGRIERLAAPSIAIVGSRRATPQGLANARALARTLSEHGLAIVSGLALGIDAAAHEGGLQGPAGSVAFVGTGLDHDYPASNALLAQRLRREGLVVSEYSLGTPPLAANFPRRNRLIAGVSLGTLVVEATVQSGSLITARLAAEAGREVFAVPGSIRSAQAHGCHQLIQQGAKLVETADDVLQELGLARTRPAEGTAAARTRAPRPPDEASKDTSKEASNAPQGGAGPSADDSLMEALGHDPVTLDALAARTGWPLDRLSARLLDLELAGRLQRLPGGLFQRHDSA
jgi:DNA processing protein